MASSSGSHFHVGSGRTAHDHRPPNGASASSSTTFATGETLYQLLGVPYTASPAAITRAYRQAMKRVHPDRARPERRAAMEELARQFNAAYATLNDPAKRRTYDESIRAQAVQEQIMGRYVSGFGGPGMGADDPFAQALRREKSSFERREKARADRSAVITIMATFGGAAAAIIAVILLLAALGWAFGAIF